MDSFEQERDGFLISTNPKLLDLKQVHQMIAESYWATNIPKNVFEKSVKNSLCFGIYTESTQVGFARVISDYATFAYIGDVFILPEYRKKGLANWMLESILVHPELQGLRRICLGTRDAHGLYEKFGFETVREPLNWMEIKVPHIYIKN